MKKIEIESIDDPHLLDGTYLQGHLNASYQQLCSVFGSPVAFVNDDNTRAEWRLSMHEDDKTIFVAIYDWRREEPVESVTEWNIGGHSARAIDLVNRAIKESQSARP